MSKLSITHVLILAALVRVIVATVSYGSNDIPIWYEFAMLVEKHGLFNVWQHQRWINHPPLPLAYAWLCMQNASEAPYLFAISLKLPAILGDLLTTRVIWLMCLEANLSPKRAILYALLFALNPIAILISGYHGNTDSLMAALLLCAFRYAQREEFGRAGLLLGCAINVKLAPLPCVLILLAGCRSRRTFGYALAGLAVCTIPFIPAFIVSFHAFFKNAMGYLPMKTQWGLMFLTVLGEPTPDWIAFIDTLRDWHRAVTRYVVIAFAVLAAILVQRGRLSPIVAAAAFLCFLLAWTETNVQYLVWPLPLLAVLRPRFAAMFGVIGGMYLVARYVEYWNHKFPFASYFDATIRPVSTWLGLLPWAMMIAATVLLLRTTVRRRVSPADGTITTERAAPGSSIGAATLTDD